jgi:hypothetical protein
MPKPNPVATTAWRDGSPRPIHQQQTNRSDADIGASDSAPSRDMRERLN